MTEVPKADAYGGVLINVEGKVQLREPAGHFGQYVWTFAKGRPDPGETPEETALREVLEETGQGAVIVALIPTVFAGTTSTNVFFLMEPQGPAGARDRAVRRLVSGRNRKWWKRADGSGCLSREIRPGASGV